MIIKCYTEDKRRPDMCSYDKKEIWIHVDEMKKYGVQKVVIELEACEKVSSISNRMGA